MNDYSDDDKAVWNAAFAWASAWGHTAHTARVRANHAVDQARLMRPWKPAVPLATFLETEVKK